MIKTSLLGAVFAWVISSISLNAFAVGVPGQGTWETTLLPRDLDGDRTTAEAYYDRVTGITWLADTKLIASNTFGLPYDTELDTSNPVAQRLSSDGKATWWGAKYWLEAMNAANYGGANQWRLPMMMDTGEIGCDWSPTGGTDCGDNVQTTSGTPPYPATTIYSELATMYYDTLGNLAGWPPPPEEGLTNTGPFDSIQLDDINEFWTGLPVPLYINGSNVGWYFIFDSGHQTNSNEWPFQYAWAVHDGDIGEGLIPTPPAYLELVKLLASDGEARDYFGASISVEGDTVLVGKAGQYEPVPVYIYTNTGEAWLEQGKLTPSDNNDHNFGSSVSIDGDTALIGAPYGGYEYDRGKAYVFLRTGDTWSEQAQLRPSGWETIFAGSVSVDGDTAVVGGILDDQPGENGSAYVYVRHNGIWTEQTILKPSGSTGEDQGEELFGNAVAIDSDTIVVGHGFDWDSQKRVVYVFTRTNDVWTEQAKLTPSDNASDRYFGNTVSLDGDTIVIGAPGSRWNGEVGAVYVYTRSNGIWTEQAILTAEDLVDGDRFATSVSVNGDTVVVGGIQGYGQDNRNGYAYAFVRDNGTWMERARIRGSDSEAGDYFGYNVSVSENFVATGATGDDDNGENSGSAYVFALTDIVTIDIKPDKKPENLVYLNKGKYLRATILGSPDFDALQVDPASLKFGPDGAMPIRYKGRDYNHDGYSDLALTFVLSETGITCGDTDADLIGKTISNPAKYIAGSDSFKVEPCP